MGDVPCNGCVECCKGPDRKLVVDIQQGMPHEIVDDCWYADGDFHLGNKPNGDCLYLSDAEGCTIYDKRPVECRKFDCRETIKDSGFPWRIRLRGEDLLLSSPV
jgi:Fe-S-cluster containining protein